MTAWLCTILSICDSAWPGGQPRDRKSTRLNSSHLVISYAVFCLKKKTAIVASVTPSYLYSPPDAALLQHELGVPLWQGSEPRQLMGADVPLSRRIMVTPPMLCCS